ncbi:MAG: sigma-54-dependent transcriptional regulator [Pseudodesulfovibrio sp.]|jgi:two-component system C4-dicarboxylate transport response regulator DctD|uniref:C4-dicarboxylate ABC transporter n=1 Tax=Pseudodesulfovibrio indicus TaxID=1716143 RepID=A0A126QS21_9BACT|nr:sigma-54 dependent transcriptional regulator [Pseudodesulfovibrio indicus]AMK12774.1 C4-dicarboxylate ABC transporter [Pseudodesulfovibrio indicus]TDT86738.1 two-component system C4-dicarboxylate transport response regulator DctD [Pseudodesulfovibrio indicus]
MTKVILVDDEQSVRDSARQWLELSDFDVTDYADARIALKDITPDYAGIVLTDVKMPGMDGLAFQKHIQDIDPHIPVVLFTGHGDIAMAVEAIQGGAYDFVEKPFDPEQIVETIKRALEKRRLVLENRQLKMALSGCEGIDSRLVGTSPSMRELKKEITHIAPTIANILIFGETGTGKEVIARAIHTLSTLNKGPYLALNCATIPVSMAESELFGHVSGAFTGASGKRVGKLEAANGGTLFLDELNSMPLDVQGKLLRALEMREIIPLGANTPRPVNFRLISAMNEHPRTAIEEGRLREDLYFRINTVEVNVPPLRERMEDIPLLFSFFLERTADTYGMTAEPLGPESLALLMSHDWPGNVRELKSLAERYILSPLPPNERIARIMPDKAGDTTPAVGLREQVSLFERHLIQESLTRNGGSIKDVMNDLAVPRRTLNEKMTKYGLKRSE